MEQEETERRGYFRVDDDVELSYRIVTQNSRDEDFKLPLNRAENTELANELEKMKSASRVHFRQVEKESPEIARYFNYLEKKIDLIAHHLIMKGDFEGFNNNTQPVSMSGSGLAFHIESELKLGDVIELKFILSPSQAGIHCYSKVVNCRSVGEGFNVAVEFVELPEEDRELLIRHVVQKQINNIRQQKD